jgi:hypothetical protein
MEPVRELEAAHFWKETQISSKEVKMAPCMEGEGGQPLSLYDIPSDKIVSPRLVTLVCH